MRKKKRLDQTQQLITATREDFRPKAVAEAIVTVDQRQEANLLLIGPSVVVQLDSELGRTTSTSSSASERTVFLYSLR